MRANLNCLRALCRHFLGDEIEPARTQMTDGWLRDCRRIHRFDQPPPDEYDEAEAYLRSIGEWED